MMRGRTNESDLSVRQKYTKMLYKHFAWFTENISNRTIPGMPIRNIEPLLCSMNNEEQEKCVLNYSSHTEDILFQNA